MTMMKEEKITYSEESRSTFNNKMGLPDNSIQLLLKESTVGVVAYIKHLEDSSRNANILIKSKEARIESLESGIKKQVKVTQEVINDCYGEVQKLEGRINRIVKGIGAEIKTKGNKEFNRGLERALKIIGEANNR